MQMPLTGTTSEYIKELCAHLKYNYYGVIFIKN